MIKIASLVLFSSLLVHAQSFLDFKEEALKKSPYLKANQLMLHKTKEENRINLRYKNPTLGLELSQFSQKPTDTKENGYRVALTQPLRLWGISSDKDALNKAQTALAQKSIYRNRALFIRDLSLYYLNYKRLAHLQELRTQEIAIAKKITDISKERFESGTIARVKYIQAKLDLQRTQNRLDELEVARLNSLYELLGFSGIKEEREIQSTHAFVLHKTSTESPDIKLLNAQKELNIAKAKLNSNQLEWIALRAEYEKEPDQDIYRVGVNIPLVIFNSKQEEQKIAKIQTKRTALLVEQKEHSNAVELQKTLHLLQKLTTLQQSTKALKNAQNELLIMYEDGYKIANIDLIELQLIKNQMIGTQQKLIELKIQKEQYIVHYNYLTGAHNE